MTLSSSPQLQLFKSHSKRLILILLLNLVQRKGKKFKGPGGGSARPTNDKGFDPALGITKKKKKGRGKRLKKNKDNFNFYEEEEPKQQADQMTYGASKQNHDDDIFAPEPVDFVSHHGQKSTANPFK